MTFMSRLRTVGYDIPSSRSIFLMLPRFFTKISINSRLFSESLQNRQGLYSPSIFVLQFGHSSLVTISSPLQVGHSSNIFLRVFFSQSLNSILKSRYTIIKISTKGNTKFVIFIHQMIPFA